VKLSKSTMFSYAFASSGGRQFITALVATYVLVFFTDTFGIGAGAAGIIMFCATVWDAINDPIMGSLADRTKSKLGRYRPYLLFIPPLLAVVSVLLFAAPDLSPAGKIVYGAFFYVCYGMLLTALEIPCNALIPVMTLDDRDRTHTVQLATFISSIVILVVSSFTLNLVAVLGKGNDPLGYMLLVGIAAVVMVASNIVAFLKIKEVNLPKYTSDGSLLRDMAKIIRVRSLFPALVIWCVGYLGFQIMMASSVYYMIYLIHRPDLIPVYMLIISVGGMLGVTFILPLCLKLFRGIKGALAATQAIVIAMNVILFFTGGSNLTLLFILTFISSVFSTMINVFTPLICVDVTDYTRHKLGQSMAATIAAIKGFSGKCGAALSNGILGVVMGITGYVANSFEQTATAMQGINSCRFLVPAVCGVIIIIALKFYPITEDMKREFAESNAALNRQ